MKAWVVAKNIAVDVYKLVEATPKVKSDFRLASQLTSSAVSIASNIAEGDELDTVKQAVKHFYYANGSAAELITQLIIVKEIGYIDTGTADELIDKCNYVSVMLKKIIKVRSQITE